jgi:hypothetical protein
VILTLAKKRSARHRKSKNPMRIPFLSVIPVEANSRPGTLRDTGPMVFVMRKPRSAAARKFLDSAYENVTQLLAEIPTLNLSFDATILGIDQDKNGLLKVVVLPRLSSDWSALP